MAVRLLVGAGREHRHVARDLRVRELDLHRAAAGAAAVEADRACPRPACPGRSCRYQKLAAAAERASDAGSPSPRSRRSPDLVRAGALRRVVDVEAGIRDAPTWRSAGSCSAAAARAGSPALLLSWWWQLRGSMNRLFFCHSKPLSASPPRPSSARAPGLRRPPRRMPRWTGGSVSPGGISRHPRLADPLLPCSWMNAASHWRASHQPRSTVRRSSMK